MKINKDKTVAVRVRRELNEELMRLAYKHRLSKSEYIRRIFRKHLKHVKAL